MKKEEKKAEYETMLQCRIRDLTREKENLSELNRKQSKAFKETMKDYRELLRDYMRIGEENKKLKHENSYRAGIVDILPKGKGHIAEETIQDLQKEIKNLKLIQETNEKQIQNDIKERDELREENKNLKEKIDKLILKIDQLEEENENLSKDLFHLTNDGKAK